MLINIAFFSAVNGYMLLAWNVELVGPRAKALIQQSIIQAHQYASKQRGIITAILFSLLWNEMCASTESSSTSWQNISLI